VKIFVSYIKPSFLFKSEILTPIHLGRAVEKENSKDGKINDEDLAWLHKNCIGDDDFEGNISNVNRRVGFLTGTYWAWKNYEKLGNPKYFGSFGYRKLLKADCLDDIQDYDFVIPKLKKHIKPIKFYLDKYGTNLYENMMNVVLKIYPQDYKDLEKHFERSFAYINEIYIFKKEHFFQFCEWIFPVFFELLKINPEEFSFSCNDYNLTKYLKQSKNEQRDIAYIIERLTGYYILKLTKNKNLKYKKIDTILYMQNNSISKEKQRNIMLQALRNKIKNLRTKNEQ
jgi:hypothetical protein